jgi:putative PIG3 family NAD(P)H quinone oxidoreductase
MRAISISKPGGPDTLVLVDKPRPEPSRGEVRVRIRATAVNRADLLQRMGHYPAPADAPPDIPGLELAGEVEALGPGVEQLAIGDRVFGLVGGGAYAEELVTHERALAKIPANLSFEEAAAVPEAFITAFDAMTQARIQTGETMLISACGSGVGTAAIQLGRALGATVVGTARTADKLERCKSLGLDLGVVVEGATFAKQVGTPDAIIELVGGPYLAEDLRCIARRGRIVLVGLLAGAKAELPLDLMLHKRVQLTGTVLRARPLEEKLAAVRAFEHHVVPLLARGAVKPIVDRTFPLADAGAAHAYMASNEGFGKIVLVC